MTTLKEVITHKLDEPITHFELKGKGACNNAYYIETETGKRIIVKEERLDKETYEQNTLSVEGNLIQSMQGLNLCIPLPHIVLISDEPQMYGYEYIVGDMMIDVWPSLHEKERIGICRTLGTFHAQIGQQMTKSDAQGLSLTVDESPELHPETIEEYMKLSIDENIPTQWRELLIKAKTIHDASSHEAIYQFIHNDAHHENILIKHAKVCGFIDWGDTEYGDIAKDFSRYIREFTDYYDYIVSAYEKESGNTVSRKRIISHALVSGFVDIIESYAKGGEERVKSERLMDFYTSELLR